MKKKRMQFKGQNITVWSPNRIARLHLTLAGKVTFGTVVAALCGQTMKVNLGGGAVATESWDLAHESFRCQRCTAQMKEHGTHK